MRTDEELMELYVKTEDQAAFGELYERYAGLLRRLVTRHVYRASDADDVVQQVFMQLHVVRQRYRVGEPLRPWLCTIAVNLCRDHGRKQVRRAETALDMDHLGRAEPEQAAAAFLESTTPVMRALESLSEVTQTIFRQHFLEERALVDIARDLGKNPSTVRVRLHRGCLDLRAQLAG